MKTGSIRVSPELKRLLDQTAAYRQRSISFILRATAIGICRKRPVIPTAIPETYYNSGPVIIPFRDLSIPVSPENFRKHLYLRCTEELRKPPENPLPSSPAIPGVDYILATSDAPEQ